LRHDERPPSRVRAVYEWLSPDKGIALVILTVNLADSLSVADMVIRIHREKPEEVYTRGDFSEIPVSAPWIDLYRQSSQGK